MMDLEKLNIVYDKTIEEWYEKYGNKSLWSFSLKDVLNGAVELDEDMCYWAIDGRFYETLEPIKKIPAKRPPKKHSSVTIPVNDSEMLDEIWKAELASAKNILRDNGYVTLTKEEYQTLKQAAEDKPKAKEERLYILYEGEFGGYIARVCDNPDAPYSITSLAKVQSQLAEDGYWVSKVCSSATDNEVFMICFKEGD